MSFLCSVKRNSKTIFRYTETWAGLSSFIIIKRNKRNHSFGSESALFLTVSWYVNPFLYISSTVLTEGTEIPCHKKTLLMT